MLSQTLHSIHIQNLFLKTTLTALFGRHHYLPSELFQLVLAFLFASPFKPKNTFVLQQGTLLISLEPPRMNLQDPRVFLPFLDQEILSANRKVSLKEGDHLMLGGKVFLSEKIKISKIWPKPQTKTQKKILTYCPKFKQFLLGKHHQSKMIDQKYLDREFLVPHYEKHLFNKYFKDVAQNQAHFCSNEVLDSYMSLITINYIQVQMESYEFNDRNDKKFKVIPEGANSQIFKGVKLVFDPQAKKWNLEGEELVIWKEEKVFSRKKTLVRTTDGKMELIEGNATKVVESFEIAFNDPQ